MVQPRAVRVTIRMKVLKKVFLQHMFNMEYLKGIETYEDLFPVIPYNSSV